MANKPYATLVIGEGSNATETPLTQDEYESLLENGMEVPSFNTQYFTIMFYL